MPTVYIIIYSLYHHVYKVAQAVQKGLEAEGVNVKIFQVPETLSDEILDKLHAPAKPDLPVITIDALTQADAFMFGVPTRFGTLPSQFKSFLDATGALWATGALSGKFVGTFFSTASQHGGQETTAYTLLTYFAHHGLNYVPLGFANSNLFDNSEVVGGSAYGAGTVANGDGSREPSEKELDIAKTQGENFAKVLNTFHRGLDVIEANGGQSNNTLTADSTDAAAVNADSNNATTTTPMEVDKVDDRIEEVNPSDNAGATGAAAAAGAVGAAAGAAAAANVAGTADNVNKVSADAANTTASPVDASTAPTTANTTTGTTPVSNNAATTNAQAASGTAAAANTANATNATAPAQQQTKPAAAAAAAPNKPISEKPAKKEKKKNDCFCM